jgi:hypothetical protein
MGSISEWQKIMSERCGKFVDQETSSPGTFDNPTPRSWQANSSTPTLAPEGDGKPSEVNSNSQVHSEDDDYYSEDSEAESDDEDRSPRFSYQVEEVWNKFAQKYSKSHMQSIVLQDWQVFDKEYARKLAKDALKSLKSGIHEGGIATFREEGEGWVDRKNETWDSSTLGTKFVWPGDLPKFRLENIRREFISWINTFGWVIEAVTFSVTDDEDSLEWNWEIKVPENWQNIH